MWSRSRNLGIHFLGVCFCNTFWVFTKVYAMILCGLFLVRPLTFCFKTHVDSQLLPPEASCTDAAMRVLASGLPPNLKELRLSFEGCGLVAVGVGSRKSLQNGRFWFIFPFTNRFFFGHPFLTHSQLVCGSFGSFVGGFCSF